MIRSGLECRCDRCGQNKFYPAGAVSMETLIASDDWDERLGRTLCSECTAAFDEMVEKFMNEIWDK